MGGLGKGLGALLSDNGVQSVDNQTIHRTLREKNSELDSIKDDIEVRKKMIEEVKKDLTIQLLLNGNVDKTQLFEMEEEIKFCFDEKERLEIEIERLTRVASISMNTQSTPNIGVNTQPGSPESEHKSEIDLTMIKEILFEDPLNPKAESQEGIQEPPARPDDMNGPENIPSPYLGDEKEHLMNLKTELNGPMEAQRVELESFGRIEEDLEEARGIMTAEANADPDPEDFIVMAPVKKKVHHLTPKRKVKMVRKVMKDTKKPRDKRFFTLLNEAQFHLTRNDSASAKRVLLEALREYSMDTDLLYHLGNAYFMEGDLDSAEIRYRKAAMADTSSFRAYNNLGIVLKKKGEREAAIQAFNQALEINDRYDRGWFNLGTIFLEMNPPMLVEARIFLRRALECNPDMKDAKEKLDMVTALLEESA